MAKRFNKDGLGSHGLTAHSFAVLHGLSDSYVEHLCKCGLITPAKKHPLTREWWIYPPAKIVLNRGAQAKTI